MSVSEFIYYIYSKFASIYAFIYYVWTAKFTYLKNHFVSTVWLGVNTWGCIFKCILYYLVKTNNICEQHMIALRSFETIRSERVCVDVFGQSFSASDNSIMCDKIETLFIYAKKLMCVHVCCYKYHSWITAGFQPTGFSVWTSVFVSRSKRSFCLVGLY